MAKKILTLILTVFLAAAAGSAFATEESMQQTSQNIQVAEIKMCDNIENRAPIGIYPVFPNDIQKIYCFTKITGAIEPAVVYHVWRYDNQVMAKVKLDIRTHSFRTWSSKNIMKDWVGYWSVDVTDADGNILDSITFEVIK